MPCHPSHQYAPKSQDRSLTPLAMSGTVDYELYEG